MLLMRDIGHKRFRCPKYSEKLQDSNQDSIKMIGDCSMSLQSHFCLVMEEWKDPFLLDLDVQRCFSSDGSSLVDSIGACSIFRQILEEMTPDVCVVSISGSRSSDVDPVIQMDLSQAYLDLNPIPRELFKDLVIIDEFEDYYSEDEDTNLGSISDPIIEVPNGSDEDLWKEGKEVFRPMDINKFIIYCRIQAVDGFNRLVRAQARGSSRVSPLTSGKEIKKSCYIECLRDSSLPP